MKQWHISIYFYQNLLGGSVSRCLQTAQSMAELERHINKCEERKCSKSGESTKKEAVKIEKIREAPREEVKSSLESSIMEKAVFSAEGTWLSQATQNI